MRATQLQFTPHVDPTSQQTLGNIPCSELMAADTTDRADWKVQTNQRHNISLVNIKEAVDAPSLQASKARLDVALGSLGCWLATCTQQGLELMSIVLLCNPGHSVTLQ